MPWQVSGGQERPQVGDTPSPSGLDPGRLAADFALQRLTSTPLPSPTAGVQPVAPAHHQAPQQLWTGRLTWGQEPNVGGSQDRQADAGGGWPGRYAHGQGTGRTGGLNAVADDSGVGYSCGGPVPMGRRGGLLPMPYVRPRGRGNGRHGSLSRSGRRAGDRARGNLAAGECWSPPQSGGLRVGAAQFNAGLTDEDTSSSDSDPGQSFPLSGAAAWERCSRLAPQMADWAAGRGTGPDGSVTAQSRSQSSSHGGWAPLDAGGSDGFAGIDSDQVRAGDEDEAAAGTGGMGGAIPEEAKNAGDSVDMALHELQIRWVADQQSPCRARSAGGAQVDTYRCALHASV
jgi:hypothetical protein